MINKLNSLKEDFINLKLSNKILINETIEV